MVKDSRFKFLLAIVCMMVEAGGQSVAAFLVKPALDGVFINKDVRMLKRIPLAIFVVYFLRSLAMFGQEYLMSFVGQNIIRRLRNRLYDRIQDLPLSSFHKERTGVLMSRVTNDVNIVKSMVSTAVTGSLRDSLTIMGLTFVIFYQIWELAVIAFLVLPAAFYPIVLFGRRVRPAGHAEGPELRAGKLHGLHAVEELLVLRIGQRVAALDVVDPQPVEFLGYQNLVLEAEDDALHLGTVPQRGVKNDDPVRHFHSPSDLYHTLIGSQ